MLKGRPTDKTEFKCEWLSARPNIARRYAALFLWKKERGGEGGETFNDCTSDVGEALPDSLSALGLSP